MRRLSAFAAVLLLITAVPAMASAAEIEVEAELLVAVKVDTTAQPADIAAALGAEVVRPLLASRGVYLLARTDLVKEREIVKKAGELAKDLAKEDGVIWAEPSWSLTAEDDRFHAWPEALPDDSTGPASADQQAFAALGLGGVTELATGAGVVVAVLDTGVDAQHPLLATHMLPGWDMVADDDDPSDETNGIDDDGNGAVDEAYGHGTFVAGVIAQVAPGASILPVRVLDADGVGEIYSVIEGIEYAIDSGADVINVSFGLVERSKSKALKEAFKRARKAGIVVVAAAGNSGVDDEHYPAAEKNIVSVAALASDGAHLASFSGRGKWVDLAAPGEDIVSAMPGGGYATWGGTSMAAPVVSAQTALLAELLPDADAHDLEKILWKSARKPAGWEGAEEGIADVLAACVEALH